MNDYRPRQAYPATSRSFFSIASLGALLIDISEMIFMARPFAADFYDDDFSVWTRVELWFLCETLKSEGRVESLELALTCESVENPDQELEGIIRELYSQVAHHHHIGVMLSDRSALDWPPLRQVWSGQLRAATVQQLANYLQRRMEDGSLRNMPSPIVAARLIVETIAFFAMHRHYDPFLTPMDDKVAEDTVAGALVNAFAK